MTGYPQQFDVMPASPPLKLHRVSGRGHTLLNTVARPVVHVRKAKMSLETGLARVFGLEGRGRVAAARQPVECLHPDPDSAAARRRDLEPRLDRLVVPAADRSGSGLDRREPPCLRPPRSLDHWASRSVLGETAVGPGGNETSVACTHRVAPVVLSLISAAGVPFLVWGLIVLDPWITAFGLAVQMAGKMWFLDRMALLCDDVSSAAEEVRPRTDR